MSRYRVVTTTNAKGWEATGKRMAASFVERWPAETHPLTVYAEGFDIDEPGIEVLRLPPWLDAFKIKYTKSGVANGRRPGGYDFRFDAVKFAHKVAALTDFGLSLGDDDIMIWLDADTFTHADVTVEWLDGLFPGDGYMAWLDRLNNYPECGFLMFRCGHRSHRVVMEEFAGVYKSGAVLRMRQTHDSFVLEQIVAGAVKVGAIGHPVSLSGDKTWHHPFVNGPLGSRIDHMKGPRKLEGRSRRVDLKRPRTEPYWAT